MKYACYRKFIQAYACQKLLKNGQFWSRRAATMFGINEVQLRHLLIDFYGVWGILEEKTSFVIVCVILN